MGTAANRTSKVWYTVAGGVLSDVYEPTIDNTNVETMQFIVTDGRTFTEIQARDTTYQVATGPSGMSCTVTSVSRAGRYRLTTTYVTDPDRDAVVVRARIQPPGLRLYARLDASVNGNGGGAPANGGADDAVVDGPTGAPVLSDDGTETSAAARDYAVPTHLALRAARRLPEASVGYAGTPGDGAAQLDTARALTPYAEAPDGNVVATARLPLDAGGDQLDETAYPILMAYQAGLAGDAGLWDDVRAAADFLLARGPAYGVERWEEQSGHSPSTVAAQIAGLTAAGEIADRQGDAVRARLYRATADHFARSVKRWTVTTTGLYAPRYFLRLSRAGDPDAAEPYNLGNGGPTEDQRRVVDAGFLELTRLGVLPPGDPDVLAALALVDRVLRRDTAHGPGWYRYGSDTPGTEDGYGDCHEPDPTSCAPSGRPWPTGNTGSGHVWPVLAGERAEHALQRGDQATATALLRAIREQSSGTGLVPEQAWENPDLAASPYGSDPATASIGLRDGGPAGSASPLTWAQAQALRLILSLGGTRPVEQPAVVRRRYADRGGAPGAVPLTLTAPADGSPAPGASVTVEGVTAPGARVDVAAAPADTGAPARVASVRAGADGSFTAAAPVSFGEVVLTVSATTPDGRTGYARRAVVGDITGATTVLDVADPEGDDHGPGVFAYPTAADFRDGAFDLRRFQVVTDDTTVYLRAELRDLTPTFGNPMGAQLLDVYVQDPAVAVRSTEAAFPQRNHRLATADAWTQRIEAQGFAAPVWVTAAGAAPAGAAVRASGATRTITVALPRDAFGTPGPGWRFAVVLHGQDGYAADQARGFAATPQPYLFGVCAEGGTQPLCAADPATMPKAMDVLVPAGSSQEDVLNPLPGPVTVPAVPVP